MQRRIEHVGTIPLGAGGRVDRWLRRHRAWLPGGRRPAAGAELLEAILGVVLHALELHLQHLVLMLQIFDGAGELA